VPRELERLLRNSMDRPLLNRVDHLDAVVDESQGRIRENRLTLGFSPGMFGR
jgi:hypothetical protein